MPAEGTKESNAEKGRAKIHRSFACIADRAKPAWRTQYRQAFARPITRRGNSTRLGQHSSCICSPSRCPHPIWPCILTPILLCITSYRQFVALQFSFPTLCLDGDCGASRPTCPTNIDLAYLALRFALVPFHPLHLGHSWHTGPRRRRITACNNPTFNLRLRTPLILVRHLIPSASQHGFARGRGGHLIAFHAVEGALHL